MAQAEKAVYYRALKSAGVPLDKHYRDYTTDQLRALLEEHGHEVPAAPEPKVPAPKPRESDDDLRTQLAALTQIVTVLAQERLQTAAAPAPAPAPGPRAPEPEPAPAPTKAPVGELDRGLDPAEHAGLNANSHGKDDVLYVDEFGNEWYQREVTKAGYAKPRGRRVLRTYDSAVKKETIQVGEYTETFEVSGDAKSSTATEIKVTLPSYQCGIYKPANMPFKVHTYNGLQGFDREDVQAYYGGRNLVPRTIKSKYVHTDWCYDIESVIETIEAEYRERVLGTTVNQRGLTA